MRKTTLVVSLFVILSAGLAEGATTESLGKKIADFTLRDFRGKERSLKEYRDHPVVVFVAGKLLAGSVLIAMVATMALLVAVLVLGLSPLRAPLAIVWCAYAGTALLCLFLSLAILGSTKRAANLIATMTVFPLMMIGGSFFPLELMPAWMATVGAWTPNGLAVVQLRQRDREGLAARVQPDRAPDGWEPQEGLASDNPCQTEVKVSEEVAWREFNGSLSVSDGVRHVSSIEHRAREAGVAFRNRRVEFEAAARVLLCAVQESWGEIPRALVFKEVRDPQSRLGLGVSGV